MQRADHGVDDGGEETRDECPRSDHRGGTERLQRQDWQLSRAAGHEIGDGLQFDLGEQEAQIRHAGAAQMPQAAPQGDDDHHVAGHERG